MKTSLSLVEYIVQKKRIHTEMMWPRRPKCSNDSTAVLVFVLVIFFVYTLMTYNEAQKENFKDLEGIEMSEGRMNNATLKLLEGIDVTEAVTTVTPEVKAYLKIAIVIVITDDTDPENYRVALDSMECYCKIHNYDFVLALDTGYNCTHTDKFFRRHCVVAKILSDYDAILYLDADVGVVNPERKIEEFLEDGIDITFVNRFYNWEIAAGYYLARNTEYAVGLLNDFADYEFKLPEGSIGTDNVALHLFLSEKLLPNSTLEVDLCRKVFNASQNFADLFSFEACIKTYFGVATHFGKVRIMKKGTGWARDGWLTSMVWHPELDFMLHGWKTNELVETPKEIVGAYQMIRNQWYNPMNGTIILAKCNPENTTWNMDSRFMGEKEVILASLRAFERDVAREQVRSGSRIDMLISQPDKPKRESPNTRDADGRLKKYFFW
ncbi:Nucleotide-diphospho-sugar transferase domain-containing protein [Caenorhabditis elegans]|uniref:Nucleotide-diphospho-sugar transferase domain-containing protein n=1 Tax=Caenorhabditis elegans TaxID=6239 RepID=O45514_CAEEL|nr:Nucleotide-diphospho-sugar transferase domain-containing protein [Caenorhabditis elegans]CAB04382.2 Nucleotide-diphospho-sugar transferase domain-containing protein [Caenorhabditis elegans]|eukprot:NP_493100.2 Uncharacterized protein CELE_F41D3.11 [Caenorhabditis elegans]